MRAEKEITPFLLALALFAISFAGLAASLYPFLIPPNITYREAANADPSLGFILIGVLVLLPIILGYTAYGYWLFRHKCVLERAIIDANRSAGILAKAHLVRGAMGRWCGAVVVLAYGLKLAMRH